MPGKYSPSYGARGAETFYAGQANVPLYTSNARTDFSLGKLPCQKQLIVKWFLCAVQVMKIS